MPKEQHKMDRWNLYEITKTLYNDKPGEAASVKDKQGNIIKDDEGRKVGWKEHFEEILKRDIPTNPVEVSKENYPETETINIKPNYQRWGQLCN